MGQLTICPMSTTLFQTLLVFSFFLFVTYFWNIKWISSSMTTTLEQSSLTVLLWDWPRLVNVRLDGNPCFEEHHIPGCYLLDDHEMFPKANVVVFHNKKLKLGLTKLPLNLPRPPEQRWAWATVEPPIHNGNVTYLNNLINWTMTYRQDADITVPYGRLILKKDDDVFQIPKKSKLACWVVSNYRPYYSRSRLYKSLSLLIPVEVYGKWSKKILKRTQLLSTISQCYFYLAFENSNYKDYITEKVWRNSFKAGSVPVVSGSSRKNYELLMPGDSFIHVDDFSSVKDLAEFLKSLAANRTRYESYFRWHQQYEVKAVTDFMEGLCQVCQRYYELPNKVYRDLDAWQREKGPY